MVIGETLALNKRLDLRWSADMGLDLLVSHHLAGLHTIPEGAKEERKKNKQKLQVERPQA